MLTVEIRINGSVIAVISAVNKGAVDTKAKYRYEYHGAAFPIDSVGPMHAFDGFINHKRFDGALLLSALLCKAGHAFMKGEKKP